MSQSIVLFVFEGHNTESQYVNLLIDKYSLQFPKIEAAYCGHIYDLFQALENDDFVDLLEVLKERQENKTTLDNIERKDISEIYLFFDYDAHVQPAADSIIDKMLETFCNETDKGKLYISYPMAEALRHAEEEEGFKELLSDIHLGRKYKGLVGDEGINDISSLSEQEWKKLIERHLKKANFLTHDEYETPQSIIEQDLIFNKQIEKHVPNKQVAVLSGFPLFHLDYIGVEKYQSDCMD